MLAHKVESIVHYVFIYMVDKGCYRYNAVVAPNASYILLHSRTNSRKATPEQQATRPRIMCLAAHVIAFHLQRITRARPQTPEAVRPRRATSKGVPCQQPRNKTIHQTPEETRAFELFDFVFIEDEDPEECDHRTINPGEPGSATTKGLDASKVKKRKRK